MGLSPLESTMWWHSKTHLAPPYFTGVRNTSLAVPVPPKLTSKTWKPLAWHTPSISQWDMGWEQVESGVRRGTPRCRRAFLWSLQFSFLFFFFCTESSLLHRLFTSSRQWGLLSSCSAQASHCSGFSCCSQGLRSQVVAIPRLWSTSSVVAAHGALLLHGMWDLPRSGIKPVSPALAGRYFNTELPGKPTITPFLYPNFLPGWWLCFLKTRVSLNCGQSHRLLDDGEKVWQITAGSGIKWIWFHSSYNTLSSKVLGKIFLGLSFSVWEMGMIIF